MIADVVNTIVETRGASASQIALARVRAQQPRAVTIPIVGARTEAQIVDNLVAIDLDLDPTELERLDEVSSVTLGFPGDFGSTSLAYSQHVRRVEDHRGTVDPLV